MFEHNESNTEDGNIHEVDLFRYFGPESRDKCVQGFKCVLLQERFRLLQESENTRSRGLRDHDSVYRMEYRVEIERSSRGEM